MTHDRFPGAVLPREPDQILLDDDRRASCQRAVEAFGVFAVRGIAVVSMDERALPWSVGGLGRRPSRIGAGCGQGSENRGEDSHQNRLAGEWAAMSRF